MHRALKSSLIILTATLTANCTMFQKQAYLSSVKASYKIHSLTEKQVDLGSDQLAYFDTPEPNTTSTPVFLIHGFTADKESWLMMVRRLKKNHRIIAVDVSGHGASSPAHDGDYSFARQAQRIHQLLKQINVPQVHLLGHSMGGGIAMKFAALYPNHTASLGLIDSTGARYQETTTFHHTLTHIHNPLIVSKDWTAYDKIKHVTSKPVFQWTFKLLANSYFTNRDTPLAPHYQTIYPVISTDTISKVELQRITQPTFILWGAQDSIIKPEQASYYHRHIPGATSKVVMIKSGHTPLLEKPHTTAQAYLNFLKQLSKQ